MSEGEYAFFVGIDWGSQNHQVCAIDVKRRVLFERSFEHSGAGLAALADAVGELDPSPQQIGIAIEVPRGAIVETMLDRGFHVFAVNPKQLDRFRDRHTTAGAKDDRRDALVLADSLRTDRAAFRALVIDDPLITELRELSRLDEELEHDLRQLMNRLRDQLQRYYPQLLKLSPAADDPWIWTLIEKAPTPEKGKRLGLGVLGRILREHVIRKWKAEQIAAVLAEPALHVAPGVSEAVAERVSTLIPRLRLTLDQRRKIEKRLKKVLEALSAHDEESAGQQNEHRDAAIILSWPGIGVRIAATMLAEAPKLLSERDYHGLRLIAGCAPVTKQSGKKRVVSMRYGSNNRLKRAMSLWAKQAVRYDPMTNAFYGAMRKRGLGHDRSLRGIADRLLAALIASLQARTLYDPTRRASKPEEEKKTTVA